MVEQPTLTLDTPTREALAELLLAMADDEFVLGFWDSEWTGIAPILEEDVATSSIAQDEIGHAKALYEMLAELTGDDADRIAYGRDADAFRHAALLNHARTDWAFTIARRFLYETADAVRLAALAHSSDAALAALATKDASRGDLPSPPRRCLAAAPLRRRRRGTGGSWPLAHLGCGPTPRRSSPRLPPRRSSCGAVSSPSRCGRSMSSGRRACARFSSR